MLGNLCFIFIWFTATASSYYYAIKRRSSVKNKFNYMRFYLALLWTLLLLFLTGCWSSKEVEELSLTAGIALDKGKDSTIEKEDEEGGYPKRNLITATYQIVSSQAQSKGNGQQKRYINVSETGDSIHQIVREFSLKRESTMFSPHLKTLLLVIVLYVHSV